MSEPNAGHRRWVRICHWIAAASFLTLALSGFLILMVHPRLYLGHAGNDLTPALLSLPISNNHRPDELTSRVVFAEVPGAPVTAERNYAIFNQNGWARSLHFLAAWILVGVGALYVALGVVGGHIGRDLLPRARELAPRALLQDLKSHLRPGVGAIGAGPPYGLLQKLSYTAVMLIVLPLMVATGLTMSPAVAAAYPFLLDVFGGYQTARTIHFFGFAALILFLLVHVAMVIATGFGRQLRAMTWGNQP
ncbi:MAG TPA: cytochrome b/b6 domain-containing protein [Steroidobacteraceae bacterium]|jgi:thiosulfate reductase cytochrome b subunit|nr:cytochrome b/b6 domain-containing protein [Steroidobacteraceae bacterium]